MTRDEHGQLQPPALSAAYFAEQRATAACLRCGATPEDAYHVLTECQHPAVLAARQEADAALPALMEEPSRGTAAVPAKPRASGTWAQPSGAAPLPSCHSSQHCPAL